jgi:GNAT superfamily N-acetyltransferase
MIQYREANKFDIADMSRIRAREWETEAYWTIRIAGYMDCTINPCQALASRIIYVATENEIVIGFIAGHLTQRFKCDGELEWIDVHDEYRRKGIASEMLKLLATWFIEHKALKICIDPGNENAREFYNWHQAEKLNEHWLVWNDINIVFQKV